MRLDEYINNMRKFTQEVEQNIPDIMVQSANDGLADIENRITTTGKNEFGEQIGEYVEGRYKEFRQDRGLETDFVSLRNTGRMWSNTKIVGVKTNGFLTTVTIGGDLKETQDKLEWNADRYDNDILALSDSEIENISKGVDHQLQVLANKFL